MNRFFITLILSAISQGVFGQSNAYDSLKMELMSIANEVDAIDLRMKKTQKRFQSGILVSTLGYSITIAGGLMLGRENDKFGQALLVTGGATGTLGTYFLLDSFNELAGRKKRRKK
ncbi:MAG: hypothetical protein ACJA08_002586 [Cyclobacteriaceae bacterium]|jgi:hypothetical protein